MKIIRSIANFILSTGAVVMVMAFNIALGLFSLFISLVMLGFVLRMFGIIS